MTFETLVDYCRRDDWPIQTEEEKGRVRSKFGGTNGRWRVTMVLDEDRQVLLFLVPFYLKAPLDDNKQEVRARLLELLLYVNYEILYGNFEYDIEDGEVRYRLSIPCEGDGLSFETFVRCAKAMMFACDHFYPACQRVLWGGMAVREAMDSLEERSGDNTQAADGSAASAEPKVDPMAEDDELTDL